MRFGVRAVSANQGVSRLVIDAIDENDARRQVREQGLYVASIRPMANWSAALGAERLGGAPFSLVLFSQELLALLRAGLGVVEALEALRDKEAQPAVNAVLSRLLAALRDGKRLSVALTEQPQVFPPLYIGVVRTAEGTSDLPRALDRFLAYQARIDAIRSKIVSAAIYPSILASVGAAVSFFLMVFVVPRFAEVYQGTGRDMPLLSRWMLQWGTFAAAHTAELLLGAGLLLGTVALWARQAWRSGAITAGLSRLPGVGERVHVYELSRLYLTLGMLLEGGIPLTSALDTVQDVVGADLRRRLSAARSMIESGLPLSVAFEAEQLTTPISLRLLAVGERSGELGTMLTQSATFYDGEITRWIDRFMRSFEPILMAAIGLAVGAIVILLYMPIFDLAGSF